jgi:hypothetical protein
MKRDEQNAVALCARRRLDKFARKRFPQFNLKHFYSFTHTQ